MALEYSLELAASMGPEQALHLIADRLGPEWISESRLEGPGIQISAIKMPANSRAIMEEAFQFSPELSVGFRFINNSPDYEEGNRVMMRATMLLLEHGRDAVLLFNGEHIILQRLGGQLTLNADYGNWTDGLRLESEIRLPYEKRSLPSPLL